MYRQKWAESFIWVFESVHIVQVISAHSETNSHWLLQQENRQFSSLERAHGGKKKNSADEITHNPFVVPALL